MLRLLMTVFGFLLLLAWVFMPGEHAKVRPALNTASADAPGNREVMLVASEKTGGRADAQQRIANGTAKVVIPRDADGHFYVDAQVGAATVHFLVDTGASAVALSRADAQRAGIAPVAGDYVGEARTANGVVKVKPVMIDRIRIGALEATNIEGAVIDGDLGVSLLGQSWLKRVGSVTIKDDQLVLN